MTKQPIDPQVVVRYCQAATHNDIVRREPIEDVRQDLHVIAGYAEALAKVVAEVLALHSPSANKDPECCTHCKDGDGWTYAYPCPTVQAAIDAGIEVGS